MRLLRFLKIGHLKLFSSLSNNRYKKMYLSLIKIRDLIKDTFGDLFKGYWIDSPNLVIFSELPALFVAPITSSINVADTGRDEQTYTIDLGIIIDAKQELLKYKKEMVGTQFLTEIMEAKDSSGQLNTNTILYVLRNNLTLGSNWMMGNTTSIDYSLNRRVAPEGNQWVTKEAVCRFSIIRFTTRT